jgi:hypothetical protein
MATRQKGDLQMYVKELRWYKAVLILGIVVVFVYGLFPHTTPLINHRLANERYLGSTEAEKEMDSYSLKDDDLVKTYAPSWIPDGYSLADCYSCKDWLIITYNGPNGKIYYQSNFNNSAEISMFETGSITEMDVLGKTCFLSKSEDNYRVSGMIEDGITYRMDSTVEYQTLLKMIASITASH